MPLSTYANGVIMNHVFRGNVAGTNMAQLSSMYLALHTADPTEAGLLSTEVSGGGYTRQLVRFSSPSGDQITTSSAVSFSNMPACTVNHLSVWDEDDNMWIYDGIAPQAVGSNDTLTWAAGTLSLKFEVSDSEI